MIRTLKFLFPYFATVLAGASSGVAKAGNHT
jgi:hypothetical protein